MCTNFVLANARRAMRSQVPLDIVDQTTYEAKNFLLLTEGQNSSRKQSNNSSYHVLQEIYNGCSCISIRL